MLRPKSANIFRFFKKKFNYIDSTQKNFYVMISNFEAVMSITLKRNDDYVIVIVVLRPITLLLRAESNHY